tara:strand:- start:20696 stop:21376 length:681 start_codon:yes stop_codon:yes gene_type:complete
MPSVRHSIASALLAIGPIVLGAACSSGDATPSSDADVNSLDGSVLAADAQPQNTSDGSPNRPDASTAAGCSAEALQLIAMVNDYRGENALPPIPASTSLCIVGDAHVGDLIDNNPDAPSQCNMHSWSDQGAWSPCCYTADHAQAQCMWDKPRELTAYTGNGYENAAGGGGTITPSQALSLWQNSSGHNAVILNEGIWANQEWKAMGAGFQNGYAVLWFGSATDPAD